MLGRPPADAGVFSHWHGRAATTGPHLGSATIRHICSVNRSVLIVDDHASFRVSARLLLSAEGYEVVGEAEDGRTGLAAAERLAPDVVLLDVRLPDTNGFEVAAELAARCAAIVVLTSSHDGSDFGTLVQNSGAGGFIPKADLSGAALDALLQGATQSPGGP